MLVYHIMRKMLVYHIMREMLVYHINGYGISAAYSILCTRPAISIKMRTSIRRCDKLGANGLRLMLSCIQAWLCDLCCLMITMESWTR